MAANTCNMPPQLFAGSAGVDDYTFGFEYINRIDVEVLSEVLIIGHNLPKVAPQQAINMNG